MRHTFFLIHKWLAIPCGIFISIMCFTGAILLWKNDIAQLLSCPADDLSFFRGVTRLHRWLFIVPDNPHGGFSAGRLIMGVSAMAATLILVSGVVLWWPRRGQKLRPRLTVSLYKGWRRLVYDSHVSLGIYATVFLLLMSLTGPVWSFGWYRKAAVTVMGMKAESGKDRPEARTAAMPAHERQRQNPAMGKDAHSEGRTAHRPTQDKAGDAPHPAPAQGGKRGGNPAQKTFISLHTGKWAGTVSKIIYFIAALIGGFLPISGYYLWLAKRKNRSHSRV